MIVYLLLLPAQLQNGKSVSSKSGKDLFFYSSVLGEGYHIYMEQWESHIAAVLPLERESSNQEDKFAVAIK